jgi:hypothetical protein
MVAAASQIASQAPLRLGYDKNVDVLYIVAGAPQDVEGDGLPGGVELGFSVSTGAPCAVTVIGYRRNNWDVKLDQLALIASKHLSVDLKFIRSAIPEAVARAERQE